jgi:uncharacterized glyoxalase superfamily protein PhnB
MQSSTKTDQPLVGPMTPLLMVYDMRRAVAFYRDVLGFEVEAQWEPAGHLYWAQLKNGGARLMLNAEYEDDKRRPEHDRPHGKDVTFYFYPKDAAALRETILRRGGRAGKMQETDYRHRQFHLKDPDGYTLCFSQELPAK